MRNFRRVLDRLRRDRSGQDLIEYGLLAMFISIAAYLTVQAIGGDVQTLYGGIQPATAAAAAAGGGS